MTSPARSAEADRVELVYYWSLQQLGNALLVDALDLWEEVPKSEAAAGSSGWLSAALDLLFGFRSEAQALAIAYYRLIRALRVGFTVVYDDGEEVGGSVPLDSLRDQFEEIVDNIEEQTRGEITPPEMQVDELPYDTAMPDLLLGDDDGSIPLEAIDIDIDDLLAQDAELSEEEAFDILDRLGLENFLKKLEAERAKDVPTQDATIVDLHSQAGARSAAAAMRIMQNAARGLVFNLADYDGRVVGWVRYSQSGAPCAFCAMLISRGVVYKSAQQAQHQGRNQEEAKFHDNCRCVAVPIFLPDQYESSDLFALNREMSALWDKHVKGKASGTDALNRWRRFLRSYYRDREASAPVAA